MKRLVDNGFIHFIKDNPGKLGGGGLNQLDFNKWINKVGLVIKFEKAADDENSCIHQCVKKQILIS